MRFRLADWLTAPFRVRRQARVASASVVQEGSQLDAGVPERVATAIANLPSDQRAVLVAVDREHRDIAHVARRLGLDDDTVRATLRQARARVATVLDQDVDVSPSRDARP